mmetsp:Transcript_221/g.525  ORF Transcript_221/g.525 Transcript_221/m.525 type:complete len:263 (-) Transcript_221:12-800(-)
MALATATYWGTALPVDCHKTNPAAVATIHTTIHASFALLVHARDTPCREAALGEKHEERSRVDTFSSWKMMSKPKKAIAKSTCTNWFSITGTVAISASDSAALSPTPSCAPEYTTDSGCDPVLTRSSSVRVWLTSSSDASRKATPVMPSVKTYFSGGYMPHMEICGMVGTWRSPRAREHETEMVTNASTSVAMGSTTRRFAILPTPSNPLQPTPLLHQWEFSYPPLPASRAVSQLVKAGLVQSKHLSCCYFSTANSRVAPSP